MTSSSIMAADYCRVRSCLKMLPKFKIAARGRLQVFLWVQKLPSDFFKVLLKFKMAAMDKLLFFLWAQKTEKLKSVIIHIVQSYCNPPSHHLEMCMWFYWNLIWPPRIDFLNICDRKKSNLIYSGGWSRTSCSLLVESSKSVKKKIKVLRGGEG